MIKHGMRDTVEYKAWSEMKQRCLNPNNDKYKWYGGRGIGICEEWIVSFQSFYDHIGKKPSGRVSLDRIDNEKNYEPGNVRWATQTEQVRNRTNTKMIAFGGEEKTLQEWAEDLGVNYQTLHRRITVYKMPLEKALVKGDRRRNERR